MHHHFVRVHGTVIMQRKLNLYIAPVAIHGDLDGFLHEYREITQHQPRRERQGSFLQQVFGCLASGLAFMHLQKVRHTDIKPKNILIHEVDHILTVLYTDFGSSLDFGRTDQGTTTGVAEGMTRKYCSPEVQQCGKRNTASDIFSLGCVLIEMAAALEPNSVEQAILKGHFHRTAPLLSSQGLFDMQFRKIFRAMTSANPQVMPSSLEIVHQIINSQVQPCLLCQRWSAVDAALSSLSTSPRPIDHSVPGSTSQDPVDSPSYTDTPPTLYSDPDVCNRSGGKPSHEFQHNISGASLLGEGEIRTSRHGEHVRTTNFDKVQSRRPCNETSQGNLLDDASYPPHLPRSGTFKKLTYRPYPHEDAATKDLHMADLAEAIDYIKESR
jgi:serine/threonine protein kinase